MATIEDYYSFFLVSHDAIETAGETYTQIDHSEYVLTVHHSNDVECQLPHDLFMDERGNVFLAMGERPVAYSYTLAYQSVEYSINNQIFTAFGDLIDRPANADYGLFTFLSSERPVDFTSTRCDIALRGPAVFVRQTDVPMSDIFRSTIITSMADVKTFIPVISVDGVGHLCYVEVFSSEDEDLDINGNNLPKSTRTLFEMIKLIAEWATVGDSPWDNADDEIVAASTEFLSRTDVTNVVIDDAYANQCDMQVVRYLKGHTDARHRPDVEEIMPMSLVAKKWIASNSFHESTVALYARVFPI